MSRLRTLSTCLLLFVCASASVGQEIWPEEVEYQTQNFEQWWGKPLVWKFADLPKNGMVPKERLPYSGYIYPDQFGGTEVVLRKYDLAFHRGQSVASAYERWDVAAHRIVTYGRRSFGGRARRSEYTPHWAGHCNGWTAAAIRHAEPRESVRKGDVVFTPADIKGLLAELYSYSETEFLGGVGQAVNAGTLHVILGNWIGIGRHPIGMDSTVGQEVWNYPIYAYSSDAKPRGPRAVEVKLNIGYVDMAMMEHHQAPRTFKFLAFHYVLDLDDEGNIKGGRFYEDSQMIDMLWTPLKPTQGGEKGNEQGNPHLDAEEVLALWRASVPEKHRQDWYNIDPTEEDAVRDETDKPAEKPAPKRVIPEPGLFPDHKEDQ